MCEYDSEEWPERRPFCPARDRMGLGKVDMNQMRGRLPQRDGARIRIRGTRTGTRFRRQTSVLE